jgi:hypothetical protein
MDEARRRWPQLIDDADTRTGLLFALAGGVKAGSGAELIPDGLARELEARLASR